MYIFIKLFLLFFIFLGLVRAEDPYEVRDIRLDVVGESDDAAKQEALLLAEKHAFTELLNRLLLKQDIPSSLQEEYSGTSLSLLISDLEITDERFGSGRYLASATIRFKPREIRRIFSERSLSYAETYSAPILLVALQRQGGDSVLWGDSNLLLRSLQEQELPEGLLRFVVPYGDIEDIGLLDLRGGDSFRDFDFAEIAERYGVGGVILLEGRLTGGSLFVSGRLFSLGVSLPFADKEYDLSELGVRTAMRLALQDFQEAWKSHNLIVGSSSETLHVGMRVSDLENLYDDLRILRGVSIIGGVRLLRLSTREALIVLDYRSSLQQLRATLLSYGLRLDRRASTGRWHLRKL